MERRHHPTVAAFYTADETFAPGGTLTLGDGAARHAVARRLGTGDTVQLLDGHGRVATCQIIRAVRAAFSVQVVQVRDIPPEPAVHLLVPVADRDRMLWLAEKAAEHGLTSWRPVLWRRSRSVNPRGEGPTFTARARARMAAALEQSGGAWLPAIYPDATPERAVGGLPECLRILADRGGASALATSFTAPVAIAVGPEGGLDDTERELLLAAGFLPVTLGATILRFETAALAGLAIARASLHPPEPPQGPHVE